MKPIYRISSIADEALTRVGSAETRASSLVGVTVGSATMRVINAASVPTTIPTAGTMYFDTTRKVLVVSNGTSMFLATGSVA